MSFLGIKRRYIAIVPVLVLSMVLSAVPAFGDGGFIPVADFNVYEPGQIAILCWNGHQERMYLSINIYADQPTEGVHFVPFPSLPKISLGDFETFEKVDDVFDRRLDFYNWDYSDGTYGGEGGNSADDSFNIHYNTKLGNHNVTVIEIVDPEDFKDQIDSLMQKVGLTIANWPVGLGDVLVNYTNKGFKYFAVDRFQIGNKEASVEPLIYDFITDELVFPLEISSILKGKTNLQLAVITAEEHPIDISNAEGILKKKGEGILEHSDVMEIDPWLEHLFTARCIGLLYEGDIDLEDLEGDFLIPSKPGIFWSKAGENTIRYEPRDGLDTPRILIYNDRISPGNDRMIMVNEASGKTLWEKSPYPLEIVAHNDYCYREIIFDDVDGDENGDLIILDHDYPDMILTRLDPGNCAKIWQTRINTGNSPLGKTFIRAYEDQALIILYTHSDLFAITLDHGFNWSGKIGQQVFLRNEPEIVNTPHAQLLKIYNASDGSTSVYDPWSGTIEKKWDTDMTGGSIVPLKGKDLLMFKDQGMFYFLNGANGSVELASLIPDGSLLSCYSEPKTPNYLYGIFLNYGVEGLNVTKVCFSDQSRSWYTLVGPKIGVPEKFDMYNGYQCDVNNDGRMEVIISQSDDIKDSRTFDIGSDITTMAFDGETGEMEFRSSGRFIGIKQQDTSGGPQLCLNHEEDITILDMRTWELHNRIRKLHPGSGEVLVSFKDMNDDGSTDIITRTYVKVSYSRYARYIGDTFINGYARSCESFIDVDSYTAYRHGCIISGTSGKLLYREGYRLYAKSMESIMMLQTDSNEISPGETVQFYIRVDDREVPITRDTLVLSSEFYAGTFSNLHELLPGVYTFKWTAPKTYVGPMTITAKIVLDSKVICSAKIELVITDEETIGSGDTEVDVNIKISTLDVEIGDPVTVEILVQSEFDPLLMDIKLHDLALCAIVIQPIQISPGRYVGTFTPVRNVNLVSMLLEVEYDGRMIHRNIWNIHLLESEVPEDRAEIKIGNLQAFPMVVGQGEPILLFLPFSGTENHNDVRIICEDGGKGGIFSTLRVLMGSLILVDYYTPSEAGIVNLSIDVYLGSRYIATGSTLISVLSESRTEVSTPDDLDISYDMKTTWSSDRWITHLFINVTRFGSYLDTVNYIQISHIDGVLVEQGSEYDGTTLNLVIEHKGEITDDLKILIWDEYGTSEILDISLRSSFTHDELDPDQNERVDTISEKEDKDPSMAIYIVVIMVLCTSLVVTVIGFALYDKKRNEINMRSVEPSPIHRRYRS